MTELRIKPTMNKCGAAEAQLHFTTSRWLYEEFMNKIVAEGYTLSEALSFLMNAYIEGN